MRPRSLHVSSLGLLLALTLVSMLAPLPAAHAETLGSHATVRNATPEIVGFDVFFDARLGAFLYEVTAGDANGAPDLDRAIFHILDADERVWTHRDDAWTHSGGQATVSGIAHVGTDVVRGPFRVHLHVYDRLDATVDADAPVTVVSPVLDKAREIRGEPVRESRIGDGPLYLPLASHVAGVAPPMLGVVAVGTLFLFAVVGFAHAATKRPVQRRGGGPRAGGRLGGAPPEPGGRRGGPGGR